jgi:hypothetical protein
MTAKNELVHHDFHLVKNLYLFSKLLLACQTPECLIIDIDSQENKIIVRILINWFE